MTHRDSAPPCPHCSHDLESSCEVRPVAGGAVETYTQRCWQCGYQRQGVYEVKSVRSMSLSHQYVARLIEMAEGVTKVKRKPKLLDLFCGAGGAGMGYHRAGFDVTGVDIAPQKNYPFTFIQADALEYLAAHGSEYDVIHASPPCQRWTSIKAEHRVKHPDLIKPARELLKATGKPYIIENIPNARKQLINPIMLCGTSFNLRVQRHRMFELGGFEILMLPPCQHDIELVYMTGSTGTSRSPKGNREHFTVAEIRKASGIDWMTMAELDEAIPPAYTEWIGHQLMKSLTICKQLPLFAAA